ACAPTAARPSRPSARGCTRSGRKPEGSRHSSRQCRIPSLLISQFVKDSRMLPRFTAVARSLSLASLLVAGPIAALELPLPPPGEDIVGQVQVIKAKYEDTFADVGVANDLGYLEMVAANPGVDPWLPGAGTEIILPTRYILPQGPREGIVIN